MKITGWILISILFFSLFTHFIYLAYPSEVVFDEAHYGKSSSAHLTSSPHFTGHPPAGSMLIAFTGWMFRITPDCTFLEIGQSCSPQIFFALRFLPALFGVLCIVIFYFFIKEITSSKNLALLGAFLLSLENAFLVQARHILIDSFLIFFGLLAMYLFFRALRKNLPRKKEFLLYFLSALSFGICISIKWTGVLMLLFIILMLIIRLIEHKISIKKFIKITLIFVITISLFYILVFYIHFKLIPGGGILDEYFGEGYGELSFPQKFIKMHWGMISAYTYTPSPGHPQESKFYKWPFMNERMSYWGGADNKIQIALQGNPVIWILSTCAMFIALISLFFKRLRKEIYKSSHILFLLVAGYLINLLPYIIITRDAFMYHYFPSYLFAMINFSIFMFYIKKHNQVVFWVLIILAILGFIVISPQTYGFPPLVPYM